MTKGKAPDLLKFFQEAADYVKELEAREEALRSLTAEAVDEMETFVKTLTGEQKVRLIRAMGFSPLGSAHDDSCIRYTHGPGFICICVPPATVWSQPDDVDKARKETWDDRRALADKWSREGSHGREKEED